ncbi:MAG: LuxR C-terminal-related transcriptional regulator [Chloroflexota bacterium]
MMRVALVDDHPLILKILRQELAREFDIHIIWDTSDASELITRINANTPDVLVLDLGFTGQGFEPVSTVKELTSRFAFMSVLILTGFDDPVWIEELLEAGAKGYVIKSDDFSLRIADGIRAVANGRTFLSASAMQGLTDSQQRRTLTARERTILRLAAEGHSNPAIAAILGVANGTVRNHISNIYSKLKVDNRDAAIRTAQNLRELPKPGATTRHELRTPLHTLLGMARLLNKKLEGENQEYVQQIIAEAERLDGLIDDLS